MGKLIVIIVCVLGWMSGSRKMREVREGRRDGVTLDDEEQSQFIFYGDGDFEDVDPGD